MTEIPVCDRSHIKSHIHTHSSKTLYPLLVLTAVEEKEETTATADRKLRGKMKEIEGEKNTSKFYQ